MSFQFEIGRENKEFLVEIMQRQSVDSPLRRR